MRGERYLVNAKPAKNLVAGIGVTSANNPSVMYVVMVINSSTATYITKSNQAVPL